MSDLHLVCRKIYNAAYIVAGKAYSGAPVAYIHISAGRDAFKSADEIVKMFNRLKWDTPLSAADLDIRLDTNLSSNLLDIQRIEEFYDDEKGSAVSYKVQPEDEKITV